MRFVLVLMIRNEEKILGRCLEAVADLVDAFCICDTGSTWMTFPFMDIIMVPCPMNVRTSSPPEVLIMSDSNFCSAANAIVEHRKNKPTKANFPIITLPNSLIDER